MIHTALWAELGITPHYLDTKSLSSPTHSLHRSPLTNTHILVRCMNGGVLQRWHLMEVLCEYQHLCTINRHTHTDSHRRCSHTHTPEQCDVKRSRARRTVGHHLHPFFSPTQNPFFPPHPSFSAHTPSVFAISAIKYVMKYDECWHMGTVCALSPLPFSSTSLPHCVHGIRSQSCMNINWGVQGFFFFFLNIFSISFADLYVFLEMMLGMNQTEA